MSRRHPGLRLNRGAPAGAAITGAGARARAAVILGCAALSFLAEPARAQQPAPGDVASKNSAAPDGSVIATAEAYASAAYEAYARKDYAQAVVLYEQALSVAPNAALVLYNIARIYDVGLHSRGLAIDYYHRFIAAPNAPPSYILIARARMADLEIAERAAVNQTIAADAAPQSEPDDEQQPLSAVSATAAELPPPAGTLEPRPIAPAVDTRLPAPAERNPWTSREVAAVAVGGAGVASVGVGIGFLLSARAKSDVWKRDCDGNDCSTQRAVDAAESASKQVAIGTAGLFAGGALMALGGVLWFVDFSGATPADAPAVSSSSWSVSPTVSASEISAAFSTRF